MTPALLLASAPASSRRRSPRLRTAPRARVRPGHHARARPCSGDARRPRLRSIAAACWMLLAFHSSQSTGYSHERVTYSCPVDFLSQSLTPCSRWIRTAQHGSRRLKIHFWHPYKRITEDGPSEEVLNDEDETLKMLKFKLVEKKQISHNVAKFKFALPTPISVLGLPIGQYISCRGQDATGEEVIKPYTPTTLDSDFGYFELVIKMYPQGRMAHHFCEMKVGDYLSVKGPKGRFKYQVGQVRAFGMLAGGSGITPMCQVARAILENPIDNIKVHLIYALDHAVMDN